MALAWRNQRKRNKFLVEWAIQTFCKSKLCEWPYLYLLRRRSVLARPEDVWGEMYRRLGRGHLRLLRRIQRGGPRRQGHEVHAPGSRTGLRAVSFYQVCSTVICSTLVNISCHRRETEFEINRRCSKPIPQNAKVRLFPKGTLLTLLFLLLK